MKTITLSGDVGWEITAQKLRKALAECEGQDVNLEISSHGGLVGEALEIYNVIADYPAPVTATIIGFALSAASYIPMAANKIVARGNAVMMLHNPWSMAIGDYRDMAKMSHVLDGLAEVLASGYSDYSGMERAQARTMMNAETWLFADEIVAAGLAAEMIPSDEDAGEGAGEEIDRTVAEAKAKSGLSRVKTRMKIEHRAVVDDRARIAAWVPIKKNDEADGGKIGEEKKMTKEEIAAAVAEAAAKAEAAGKVAGAEAERQRIADIKSQALPGHETIIEAMIADGKSTGADAAIAIVAAENAARKAALERLERDGNPPAPFAAVPQGGQETMSRAQWRNLSPRDRADYAAKGGKITD
ncbi:MAG: Clp protease ClpP [Desulfobulbaceae bacterium]|jgi:ATP-dependent protease ClpP protease subunit|nr:Clp protease ClpP [Desulfobulbaceae bacterium]